MISNLLRPIFGAVLLLLSAFTFAQEEDLLSLVDDPESQKPKKVYATFKAYRLGNAQTTETVKKRHLDFRISHRFGNIYDSNNDNPINASFQSYLGFDAANDIRTSFDYGLTDNITIGIGRSKFRKMADASFKWRLLQQTDNFSIPVSVALFADMGYTHAHTNEPSMYDGIVKDFQTNELHRFNYVSQLIIACKVNDWFSMELVPGYIHRNFIKEAINPNRGTGGRN